MNPANCEDYDNCVQSELEYLREPIDEQSLYANRFYDNQVAANRCYNKFNPIEGFNDIGNLRYDRKASMFKKFLCFLISLVAIILAIVFCCSTCKKNKHMHKDFYNNSPNVVHLDIDTENRIPTTSYNRY